MNIEDLDYDMYIEKFDERNSTMRKIDETYRLMNVVIADENLTFADKLETLNYFVTIVNNAIFTTILHSSELKECYDLIEMIQSKIKELEEENV